MFAAQSRQIAEFEGAGPIQSSPPYHGHIDIFQTATSQDGMDTFCFPISVVQPHQKARKLPSTKIGSEYDVCFLKTHFWKKETPTIYN